MILQIPNSRTTPNSQIAALIDRFGALSVLGAVLRAMLNARRRRQITAEDLSDHLRRDVGLTPMAQSPPMQRPPF